MQKRTKRKPAPKASPTTAERLRREEESALRRNVRAEQRIKKLARALSSSIRSRDVALAELHAELDNYLRKPSHTEPAGEAFK